MKHRILNGWTFPRIIYLMMGLIIIIQSIISRQWIGIFPGGYFVAMGLFALGCAGGNCNPEVKQNNKKDTGDIPFEEIK